MRNENKFLEEIKESLIHGGYGAGSYLYENFTHFISLLPMIKYNYFDDEDLNKQEIHISTLNKILDNIESIFGALLQAFE